MASHKVTLRPPAQNDLIEIADYIVEQSGHVHVAEQFVERIYDRCQRLGQTPFAGRLRDDIIEDMRALPFESVIIFYVVSEDSVRIIGIIHGSRDYEDLLREDLARR